MLPLAYLGEPVLLKKSQEVPEKEFSTAKIQTFVHGFMQTAGNLPAAGLAAPQVFKSLRMFCLVLDKEDLDYTVTKASSKSVPSQLIEAGKVFLVVNPKLEFHSKETEYDAEACLSIPYYYGIVERYKSVTLHFSDLLSNQYTLVANGFMARVIQHEFDHLNGILFLDRVHSTEDLYYMGEDQKKSHKL